MLTIPWNTYEECPIAKFLAFAEPVGDGNVEFVVGPVSLADIMEVQGDVGSYVTDLIEGGMDLGEPDVWFINKEVKNNQVYIGVRVNADYYGKELDGDETKTGN